MKTLIFSVALLLLLQTNANADWRMSHQNQYSSAAVTNSAKEMFIMVYVKAEETIYFQLFSSPGCVQDWTGYVKVTTDTETMNVYAECRPGGSSNALLLFNPSNIKKLLSKSKRVSFSTSYRKFNPFLIEGIDKAYIDMFRN